jgi:hypothetical protein
MLAVLHTPKVVILAVAVAAALAALVDPVAPTLVALAVSEFRTIIELVQTSTTVAAVVVLAGVVAVQLAATAVAATAVAPELMLLPIPAVAVVLVMQLAVLITAVMEDLESLLYVMQHK